MDEKEKEMTLQKMQMIEQNLQNLLLQKQAFNMELTETKSAKGQVEKSGEEVFKLIGQILIKTEAKPVLEDLSNKEKLIELRLKTMEKQESDLSEKLQKLQKEVLG